ncbi:universal stress protein [Mycobacterium marinum]|uniref:universal stress protein n=1 Tax=Mycobacterium marinum TaxID=1781 RepID=UPI0021C2A5B5|nr:universal stress protein [Mycobacterium marinum]GJN98546.1 universal stress protein [Mycobacterium marinum]GJO00153.1 universal stress protein [Mycobacterium marinum]GJO04876.1 universal stress protein [Mycobacterium marinum]GJO13756.1 universal stress protein [Mycobacterium marinum]GJO28843.1 universal stress protein [Mycobacterium marinum]
MSTESTSPAIVVGVDGSPASTLAVEWAARDAEMRNVPLKVVHVFAPMVTPANGWADVAMPADYARWREDQAHQIVQQAHAVAVDAAAPGRAAHVTSEVRYAAIVPAMVELSQQAEMVVMGCRGQGGVASALLGSVSSGLAHHAHCPVAIIHDDEALPPCSAQAPVLVGVDGSPTSELATEIAFDEASRRGAELVALHAWTDMGPLDFPSINWAPIEWSNIKDQEEEVLAERLCGWQERYPDVVTHKVVVSDRPAPRLLEHAHDAQLVVVGSHGRGGFPGMLLGSVSRAVINSARIPVIIARTPPNS